MYNENKKDESGNTSRLTFYIILTRFFMLDIKKINAAINLITAEKKIPKETLVAIIESAIKTAYKKDYGSKDEEVNVKLDMDSWNIEITVEKTVVKEVENPNTEISFDDLWDDADDFEEGDVIEIDVTEEVLASSLWESFWRIASQAARQVIIQKIWDSEKQKIYEIFKDKVWEILSMKVVMVESKKVILDYNGDQVILPKSEQVSRDDYTPDSRIYIYVAKAEIDEKNGPRVVLSRKNSDLVLKLCEMNVPELQDGTVEVEKIVRYAWVKTKILVSSALEEIDAAGCVIWQRWSRIKSVMEELRWEKIDVIVDNGNVEAMIKKSLTPAEVETVEVNEEEKTAKVFLKDTERAKAIWKNWVNINLASKLVGYNISIEVK